MENKLRPIKYEEETNLSELLRLTVQQYIDFVDRKERLENKALGYLTPLSIFLAASVAILIMMVTQEKGENTIFFFSIIAFIGQFNFSIWTTVFALRAYSVKTSYYPDIKDYSTRWQNEKSDFLGGIIQTFQVSIKHLNKLLKKLVGNMNICRIFLIFSLIFGILNIVLFILYLLFYF